MSKRSRKNALPSPKDTTYYLRARPWLRRQLGEAPALALFWREGPGGSRQGMLWSLSACGSPDCPCRDVFVQAIAVPDSMIWAQLSGETIQTSIAPDPKGLAGPYVKRTAFAKVNVATGAVSVERERTDAALFAWLQAELDAAVLAELRAAWNRVRGRPADAALPQVQP